MASKAGMKRYRKFHGRAPSKMRFVDLPRPKEIIYLGRGVAIEYESDKVLEAGDRRLPKKRNYRHEFGAGVQIYTDPKGQALFIKGGRFRVTDWMRD